MEIVQKTTRKQARVAICRRKQPTRIEGAHMFHVLNSAAVQLPCVRRCPAPAYPTLRVYYARLEPAPLRTAAVVVVELPKMHAHDENIQLASAGTLPRGASPKRLHPPARSRRAHGPDRSLLVQNRTTADKAHRSQAGSLHPSTTVQTFRIHWEVESVSSLVPCSCVCVIVSIRAVAISGSVSMSAVAGRLSLFRLRITSAVQSVV